MREVVTQDNFKATLGPEPNPDLNNDDQVERDGYRDIKDVVEELQSAGMRLQEFRKLEYDNVDEEVDELPIGRAQDFEMADASMIKEAEAKRLGKLDSDNKAAAAKAAAAPKAEESKPEVK